MLTVKFKAYFLICTSCCLHFFVFSQDIPNSDEYAYGRAIKCKRDDGTSQRCMPVFENVAFNRQIYANNTCGLKRASQYCVQTGTSGARKICDLCDNNIAGLRHPPDLVTDIAVDNNPTWWQSETLLENKNGVHLIIDFKKKYNIAFVRIRFHTIRPHSFAIYKKSTYDPDEQWLPYQFYSRTCQQTYNLKNDGSATINNQKIALCTDKASRMTPLSGGNVAYLTLDHRPGKKRFDEYPALQEWVTVTQLRFNLDRLNTFGDEVFGDPKVLKSYYFAISDITVGGRCKCNGHSSTCTQGASAEYYCECDHYTAGKDCEKCLPLFNDRPWRRASGLDANSCKKCNCNGLADECEFDEQIWVDSNYISGGRCKNCQQNTAGINCERCKEYHYRSGSTQYCTACNCNSIGSRTLGCSSTGICSCKPGVTGEKCDRCKPGYFGFSAGGCRQCNCNKQGSLSGNCDASGQCQCKENVVGTRCDQCKANHFDMDGRNPKGCKACFCYGHGITCKSTKGIGTKEITSTFETDFDGWRLEDKSGNNYNKNLEWNPTARYIFIDPVKNTNLYFVAPYRYLGNKLSSYGKSFKFTYGIYRNIGDPDIQIGSEDIILEGAGLTATYPVTSQNNEIPKSRFVNFVYKLVEPADMSTFDFQKLLSDLRSIKIRVTYLDNRRGAIDDIALQSTQYISQNSPGQVTWQEECECKPGYSGDQCQNCASGYTRETVGSGSLGRCVPCECNNHGSVCDPETGVCQCEDNTAGKNCQKCKDGFYGNPTRGNKDDCKPCPCIFSNKCLQLGDRVQCTDCPEGHEGDKCQKCSDGYFGDPEGQLGQATRCQLCDCNGNVDPNSKGNCDGLTGACLRCVNNTKNGPDNKCEVCDDGFFGDALADPKGNCTACQCYEQGTKKPAGHQPGDPIPCDKSGRCECLENVIGDKCDMCPAGHWNVKSGTGCEKCGCDSAGAMGEDCDIETGQCKCKPGVAGRTCNQCDAGHYKFSAQGCEACKCHPDGAKSQDCTQDGVCDCKPGVLGIKCDQCPENKYNLSVGCIACPKCFDLVQVAVTRLREKLSNFNFTTGNYTNIDPGLNIRDNDFEAALEAFSKEVNELKKKAEKLVKGDKDLFTLIKELSEKLKKMIDRFVVLKEMLDKSGVNVKNGQSNITRAEEVIEEIKKLLKDAEDRIRLEVGKLSNTTITTDSDIAKQMKDIAEEARKLANKHEEDASTIKMVADMALNTSTDAYNTAKMARDTEEAVNKKLQDMISNSSLADGLAEESRALIKEAGNLSAMALTEANQLIDEAMEPLPSLNANETKVEAERVSETADNVDRKSRELVSNNTEAIKQLAKDDVEARKLMVEGRKLMNESDSLYERSKNASEHAKRAQAEGQKVANDAKKMLEDLQGFEEKIARSKANASEALKLIPLIKRLIKDANVTGKEADEKVSSAENDAKMSLDIAMTANKTTQTAQEAIDEVMQQARDLLNDTMSFMMNELKDTKDDIKKTNDSLKEHKQKAIEDGKIVEDARQTATNASQLAQKTQKDLENSLDAVEKLVNDIEALEEIDMATLEDAEKRFTDAKETIDGKIRLEIEFLEKLLVEQNSTITMHQLDFEEERRQVAHINKMFLALPRGCFFAQPAIETTLK